MNNWLIEGQQLTTMRLRDVLRTSWLTQKPTIMLRPSILCACPTVSNQSNGCPEGGTLLVLSPSFCSTVSMGSRPSASNLSGKEVHNTQWTGSILLLANMKPTAAGLAYFASRSSSYFRNCTIIYKMEKSLLKIKQESLTWFHWLCMLWTWKIIDRQLDRMSTITTIFRSLYLPKFDNITPTESTAVLTEIWHLLLLSSVSIITNWD